MPFKATPTDGFVHVQWHGLIQMRDLLDLADRMPRFARSMGYAPSVLHTFDGVTGTRVEPLEMLQQALRRRDLRLANEVRIAWVARDFGLRRMGELFRELNRHPRISVQLFDSLAEAKSWVLPAAREETRNGTSGAR